MSKQSKDALASIERLVFKEPDPIVVAITAGWGEGKTYFWKEKVQPQYASTKSGYISVFGADSLAAVRERVVLSTYSFSDLAEDEHSTKFWRNFAATFGKGARQFFGHLGQRFGISDAIITELLQTRRLKPKWIICIDDVERLSANVGLDNLLGYVAELRDKWKLKVVLIFNEEGFRGDAPEVFRLFEEKVIDRSIPFMLDVNEVADIAFGKLRVVDSHLYEEAKIRSERLGLRNIRIARRALGFFEEIREVIGSGASPQFLLESLRSLVLFAYTKYSNRRPTTLTFEMLARHSEISDRMAQPDSIFDDDDDKRDPAKVLLERYEYLYSNELDLLLLDFVKTGILDTSKLLELHDKHVTEEKYGTVRQSFRKIWDTLYHGKLGDNASELCDAIEEVLPEFLLFISPGELDFALVVLERFGRADRAEAYFERFKELRGATFENLGPGEQPIGPITYVPLREFLHKAAGRGVDDNRSLAEALESAFKDEFVGSRDSRRIAQFTIEELVQYFVEHDQPHLTSKLRELGKSSEMALRTKVREVAEKIAEMNPLNRLRMEGMGLVRPNTPPEEIEPGDQNNS